MYSFVSPNAQMINITEHDLQSFVFIFLTLFFNI